MVCDTMPRLFSGWLYVQSERPLCIQTASV